MLQEDRDICQRSGDGRKIAVKKMPKPKRPSPPPAVGTSKYLKKTSYVDDIRPSPTAAGSSMPSASPTTENRMQLHSLAMPMVEPLQPQLPQPWVDKKFPHHGQRTTVDGSRAPEVANKVDLCKSPCQPYVLVTAVKVRQNTASLQFGTPAALHACISIRSLHGHSFARLHVEWQFEQYS